MDIASGMKEIAEVPLKNLNDMRAATGELPHEVTATQTTAMEGQLPSEQVAETNPLSRTGELPKERALAELVQPEVRLPHETEPAECIPTRNDRYEGQFHPDTGIPYHRQEINLPDGRRVEVVVPEFKSEFDVQMPKDYYTASLAEQNTFCMEKLKTAVESDPTLQKQFTDVQLEQIKNGDKPDDYTWHHNEQPGKMQLVSSDIHEKTRHTGGNSLWGNAA